MKAAPQNGGSVSTRPSISAIASASSACAKIKLGFDLAALKRIDSVAQFGTKVFDLAFEFVGLRLIPYAKDDQRRRIGNDDVRDRESDRQRRGWGSRFGVGGSAANTKSGAPLILDDGIPVGIITGY